MCIITWTENSLVCIFFAADAYENKVPEHFPNKLLIDETARDIIRPEYRRPNMFDDDQYQYFLTRILSAINPGVTNFNTRKSRELISDIFTVSDEAFGLMMIHNEYRVWVEQKKIKDGPDPRRKGREKKRYCDQRSGSKDGWTQEGMRVFSKLCKRVKELREGEETGREFEMLVKEKFVREQRGNNDDNNDDSNSKASDFEEEVYVDPGMVDFLGEVESV